jgi:hypothetical protein
MEKRCAKFLLNLFLILGMALLPLPSMGREINYEGWTIPDLKGLIPYNISVKLIDGIEKIVEKYYLPYGGHVARISGNGKVFAYAVDSDQEPPIDYLLLDPDGYGRFTYKLMGEESYIIPDWVSH